MFNGLRPFWAAAFRFAFSSGVIALAAALFLSAPAARAQQTVSTGDIQGTVTDPQNAAVVGALVTLTDKTTGQVRTTQTNETGRYEFAQVPVGDYDMAITKDGFSSAKVAAQHVDIGTVITIPVQLRVGATSQTIEVTAVAGAELQTANSTMGTTIDTKSLQLLPNINRDASALATLEPGSTPAGNTGGLAADQNSYQLDGGNVSDDMAGTNNTYTPSFANSNPVNTGGNPTGAVPTPVESIEEVKVNVANQTADFNGSGGSQVIMATKRGGNVWHGSAYEYYLDSHIGQANTWDNLRLGPGPCTAFGKTSAGASTCISVPSTHRNRFGASAGGPLPIGSFLGGKWFLFGNYEGLRYPFITNFETFVPSATLRAGVIGFQDPGQSATCGATQTCTYFNINPYPVTVNGVTYQPTTACGVANGGCDPRYIGLNYYTQQIWNKMLPLPNDPTVGDSINSMGYISPLKLPVTSNFGVGRLDHDFGTKWHWMISYRYYRLTYSGTQQVDIGGILPGDTFGQAASKITRPVIPSYYVTGLTTNITTNVTNDFHANYTRNFWLWASSLVPPQFNASNCTAPCQPLSAPIELGGENANALIPYNVNAQSVRQRFWDGQDWQLRDDITWLHGNHVFNIGGLYQRNWDEHNRDDNGVQTLAGLVYVSGGTVNSTTGAQQGQMSASVIPTPAGCGGAVTTNCITNGTTWAQLYQESLGILDLPQTIFTRGGSNFTLCSVSNTCSTTSSTSVVTIPSYNIYFNDTWHVKPSLTVSYGLGYTIEMPPFDVSGVQTMLVNADGSPVEANAWLAQRQQAALQGNVYLPEVGYELIHNTGRKYAYDPFYGGLAPHVSAAWSPRFDNGFLGKILGTNKTVIRGGWSRIYGRLNGVDLVLVPMLGAGPLQVDLCNGPLNTGSNQCANGATTFTPSSAFRIGTVCTAGATSVSGLNGGVCGDGTTAPLPQVQPFLNQPYLPGFSQNSGITAPITGDTSQLDPSFKPNRSDEFALSIQRELPGRMLLEVGYIGRRIRNEYQAMELSSVPYMTTLGGQEFVGAFDYLYQQLANPAYGGAGLNSKTIGTGGGGAGTCTTGSTTCPISAQPFFESAFTMPAGSPGSFVLNGRTVSNYCSGFLSCTAAVAAKQASNIAGNSSNTGLATITANGVLLYNMWNGMPMTFGNATCPSCSAAAVPPAFASLYAQSQLNSISMETSNGYGNYNAAIVSLTVPNWHGLSARSNFTWGRSLGSGDYNQSTSSTSIADPFDLARAYGPESYDLRFIYNLTMIYSPPFYKSQHGIMGHLLGGWAIAPIFTANSGAPLAVTSNGSCSPNAWGAVPCNLGGFQNAALQGPFTQGNSLQAGGNASTGCTQGAFANIGTTNPTGLNLFSSPCAAYADFAPVVPGLNQTSGGAGVIRGFPTWNLDATASKDIHFSERMGLQFYFSFTNVLNHVQYSNPSLQLTSPTTFGRITASSGAVRQLESGLRYYF